jgi:shikimate kinase
LENFSLKQPIALLGMMGAGKTSVGRALADLLSIPFFDSDREIEASTGSSVSEIFATRGEPEFRRLELQTVARLLNGGACVLSLGGGAFMAAETREAIKANAISVWLQVDRELLFQRLQHDTTRPLLKGGDAKQKLERLLSEREPVYATADLVIPCDGRPVAENARHVLDAIRASQASRTA